MSGWHQNGLDHGWLLLVLLRRRRLWWSEEEEKRGGGGGNIRCPPTQLPSSGGDRNGKERRQPILLRYFRGKWTYIPLSFYRLWQKKEENNLGANQYFMTSQCVFNCRKNDISLKKRRNGLFFFLLFKIWEKRAGHIRIAQKEKCLSLLLLLSSIGIAVTARGGERRRD